MLIGFIIPIRLLSQTVDMTSYDRPVKVACIGDSITYGLGIINRAENSYPSKLAKMLGDRWTVRNYGLSSRTLLSKGDFPYIKECYYKKALKWRPDVVIIKLGTNDSKSWNWKHVDEFETDYSAFLAPFKGQIPSPRIFICLTIPVIKDLWGISGDKLKDVINPLIRKISEVENVSCIDLYTPLSGKTELFSDGLHPNAGGAIIIAAEVYKALTGNDETFDDIK
jgi:lysophospholipase L1-like esterase